MEDRSTQGQVRLFRALAHPARLAILAVLRRDDEACVCHLEAHLGYRQAYLSQQLATLREAGLVLDRRDGWNVFYRIADPALLAVLDAALALAGGPAAVERVSARARPCACPHCVAGGECA